MNRREWLLRVGAAAAALPVMTACDPSRRTGNVVEKVSPRVAEAYVPIDEIDCIGCQNCMPCPYGIDIPSNLLFIDNARRKGFLPGAVDDPDFLALGSEFFDRFCNAIPDSAQSQHCIRCGECQGKCPTGIDIIHRLTQITAMTDLIRNLRCKEGV